jgi:PAS domain-containing protein
LSFNTSESPATIREGEKTMDDVSVEYISRKNTLLDVVLNGIADGVYVVDEKRKIIFWNEGAENLSKGN